MVTWLPMVKLVAPNARSQCSMKAVRATINLDYDPDGVAGDAKSDIAEVNVVFD